MDLSREILQREIDSSEAALKAHKDGILIHEIVLKSFKEELGKLPKEESKVPTGVECTYIV